MLLGVRASWHYVSKIGAREAELMEVTESSATVCLSIVLQFPSTLMARLDWIVMDTGK